MYSFTNFLSNKRIYNNYKVILFKNHYYLYNQMEIFSLFTGKLNSCWHTQFFQRYFIIFDKLTASGMFHSDTLENVMKFILDPVFSVTTLNLNILLSCEKALMNLYRFLQNSETIRRPLSLLFNLNSTFFYLNCHLKSWSIFYIFRKRIFANMWNVSKIYFNVPFIWINY